MLRICKVESFQHSRVWAKCVFLAAVIHDANEVFSFLKLYFESDFCKSVWILCLRKKIIEKYLIVYGKFEPLSNSIFFSCAVFQNQFMFTVFVWLDREVEFSASAVYRWCACICPVESSNIIEVIILRYNLKLIHMYSLSLKVWN